MSMEPSVVVRAFPDDGTSHRRHRRPPAVTPGDGTSYRSSKPRPLRQGESSKRMSPATMVSPEHDEFRLSAKPRPSRRRSSSNRDRRIKRTVERQRAADQSATRTAADEIANAFIGTLSDLAKSFLYPEAETPKKEPEKISKKKEKKEAQDVAQDLSETVSTVDTDDEGHSLPTYSEEGTADNSTTVYTVMGSSVASSRTPPPPLVGSDGSAFAPSIVPMNVHRPIPKSCRELNVNPLFPVDEDAKTSPMARMRAPPPPTQPRSVRSDDTKSHKSIEDIVAEKHRKWRRQIKMQRRRRRDDDDTSLLTTCGPSPSKGQKPGKIFRRPICAPCAHVDDVVCDDDRSFEYDSSSDDSSSTESSVTEDISIAAESEAHPSPRKVALKAPGSPARLLSPSLAAESGDSEQSGVKDKNFVQIFIQQMSQDGMMLIWHGSQGDSTVLQRPCGVLAYLKLGSTHADGVYEPPRLAWRKQDGSDGGDIDLFDIQSLDTASYDMLGHFPFAIQGNSFFVALNNGSHVVFEAGSDAEARRFVHGLRWVVARLSFNLVVGNPLVSCELLSVPNHGKVSPQTPMEEALWSKAMNDVTNRLVDGVLKI